MTGRGAGVLTIGGVPEHVPQRADSGTSGHRWFDGLGVLSQVHSVESGWAKLGEVLGRFVPPGQWWVCFPGPHLRFSLTGSQPPRKGARPWPDHRISA